MPFLISRQEAIEKINKTIDKGECLVCNILSTNNNYVLDKGKHTTIVLSKYPRTWGQTMVLLNDHKESISQLTKEEWSELLEMTRKYTVRIETVLRPLRCYVASLGATENLPNTCPHIHFNIIPIYDQNDKPIDIFTWEKGVYKGTEKEWEVLLDQLKSI